MLQRTPPRRILLATKPVDFRTGIDGLAALCRPVRTPIPLHGTVFVFRNRASTALTILMYDGQGCWLCPKRLSHGRFTWWPTVQDASAALSAHPLCVPLTHPTSPAACPGPLPAASSALPDSPRHGRALQHTST